jgi:sec-independent protein translocase protein TatA
MPTVLLIFEFLGTTELLVIAVVALIIFGPRKLPEIGRAVGKGIAEFKRASDDFKRTWEFEVELEQRKSVPETEVSPVAPSPASAGELAEGGAHTDAGGEPVARTPSTWQQDGAAEAGGWDVAAGHAQTSAPSAAAEGAEVSHADGVQIPPAGGGENKAS